MTKDLILEKNTDQDWGCFDYYIRDSRGGIIGAVDEDSNASLFHAAPDLLDASVNLLSMVKAQLHQHPDDPTLRAAVDMAEEAIAKAKGGL